MPNHGYYVLFYCGDSGDLQVDFVVFNNLLGDSDDCSSHVGSWNSPKKEPELKPTSFFMGFMRCLKN